MTWEELKLKIEAMTPEEQQQTVQAWGEDVSLRNANLEKTSEDMYFNPYWDGCSPESELSGEDFEDPGLQKVAEKGMYYLWID